MAEPQTARQRASETMSRITTPFFSDESATSLEPQDKLVTYVYWPVKTP